MSIDPYERAYASSRRRTEEAQAQIDAARAEPTSAEIEAEMADAGLGLHDGGDRTIRDALAEGNQRRIEYLKTKSPRHDAFVEAMKEVDVQYDAAVDERRNAPTSYRGIDPTPPDSLTLSGAKLTAYRQLESASVAAHAAQEAMATTGQALRDAIQAMCAAMTEKQ